VSENESGDEMLQRHGRLLIDPIINASEWSTPCT
jgi:hypothetical protein